MTKNKKVICTHCNQIVNVLPDGRQPYAIVANKDFCIECSYCIVRYIIDEKTNWVYVPENKIVVHEYNKCPRIISESAKIRVPGPLTSPPKDVIIDDREEGGKETKEDKIKGLKKEIEELIKQEAELMRIKNEDNL